MGDKKYIELGGLEELEQLREEVKLWKEKAEAYRQQGLVSYKQARQLTKLNEALLTKQAEILTKLDEIRKDLI